MIKILPNLVILCKIWLPFVIFGVKKMMFFRQNVHLVDSWPKITQNNQTWVKKRKKASFCIIFDQKSKRGTFYRKKHHLFWTKNDKKWSNLTKFCTKSWKMHIFQVDAKKRNILDKKLRNWTWKLTKAIKNVNFFSFCYKMAKNIIFCQVGRFSSRFIDVFGWRNLVLFEHRRKKIQKRVKKRRDDIIYFLRCFFAAFGRFGVKICNFHKKIKFLSKSDQKDPLSIEK